MCGGATAFEQAGRAQGERPGADRGDPPCARHLGRDDLFKVSRNTLVDKAFTTEHDDRVKRISQRRRRGGGQSQT